MTNEAMKPVTLQTVQQIFAEASMQRLCIIVAYPSRAGVPVPGTGSLVRHCDDLFVVTCEHVARDFFAMHRGDLLFRRMPKVPRSSCHLVYSDKALDLAVIHIHREASAKLVNLQPLAMDEFGGELSFRRATAKSPLHYVVAGFPGALATFGPEPRKIQLNSLVLGTTVRRRRGARLELDYDHAIKDGRLLPAPGLSGALVFELHEPSGTSMWKPGVAVGVQHAWNEVEKILVCSPVYPCMDAIRRHAGERTPSRRQTRPRGAQA